MISALAIGACVGMGQESEPFAREDLDEHCELLLSNGVAVPLALRRQPESSKKGADEKNSPPILTEESLPSLLDPTPRELPSQTPFLSASTEKDHRPNDQVGSQPQPAPDDTARGARRCSVDWLEP